ncbi:VOC family protein [Paenarthrobacter sp. DKR-5]|uniref:VOC family protein n=1 Tax=Paenarthrobacter sp. DKR-5 TaxID=2835535 RepID=UPI001BDC184A|nr:VOC family protein [Paenarthrobacter sp. DKR-5]MBT1003691.1 VOC family protein [Paenarthrobacter sp. DKR-5]
MEPRISIITLGVKDVDAARRFYVEGLGWKAALEVEGEVVFIQAGHGLLLGLWSRERMVDDAGLPDLAGMPGSALHAPMTLSHNVESAAAVDAVIAEAVAAGGVLVRPAAEQSWGGYAGYFADPDGFRWEIAWNPSLTVQEDGTVRFS